MHTEQPTGGFSLIEDTLASVRRPEFWTFSAWLDLITKYRRSRLGVLWMFLPPAATVYLLGYFYAGISERDPLIFMPYMGVGYILWRFVTQVVSEASSAMLVHRAFIMDGRTRYTDYVLRCISKAGLYFLAAFAVVSIALVSSPLFTIGGVSTLLATLPIFLVDLFGLGVCLALLGARFPDTHEATTTVFIFGFLLTPILWYPEDIQHGSFRWMFMLANPAFHLIEFVRAPLLGRPLSSLTLIFIGAISTMSLTMAIVLYRRYARFVPLWI